MVLCVTEITSWGVLYYAFPVLAPSISADTGWSSTAVTAGVLRGLVVSALVGVPVGRLLDRVGPRLVMTAGSVLGDAGSLRWSPAPRHCVVPGRVAGGRRGDGRRVLYQPAFAALTRWYGPRRVTALTTLTLVAGLASTVFAPLTAALVEPARAGGRRTLVLAVRAGRRSPCLATCWACGCRGAGRRTTGSPAHAPRRGGPQRRLRRLAVGDRAWPRSLSTPSVVNLVPLLHERGLSTSEAAVALGLGGVGQVLGRLGYGRLTTATTVRTRTAIVLLAAAATIVLLGLLPGPALALLIAAVLAGSARGIFTLLQATAVTDRWGATHYGRLNGLLSRTQHIRRRPGTLGRRRPGRTSGRLSRHVLRPRRNGRPRRGAGDAGTAWMTASEASLRAGEWATESIATGWEVVRFARRKRGRRRRGTEATCRSC